MQVRFWGTRGSIAKPGPSTLRYGGNTSCVQVETASGTQIVLDCGTGAHGLGLDLLSSGKKRGHLLISHTHWDHIQGFPFFTPLFIPGNEWDIYAPGPGGSGLEDVLRGQMEYRYFPVTLDAMGAEIRFHNLAEGVFELGDARITARYLNHPAVALGYRIEVGGVTVIYSTDHEPHSRLQAEPEAPHAGATPALIHGEDEKHAEFLAGADLLIHDSQYTAAEYDKKVGWGHSTVEYVVDLAVAAGVKQLGLFHHDPLRNDGALDDVLVVCRERVRAWEAGLQVFGAAEGQTLRFAEGGTAALGAGAAAVNGALAPPEQATVLVVEGDPDVTGLIGLALQEDGYRIVTTRDGASGLAAARRERPALILLDWEMPAMTGPEVCRALRAEPDAALASTPVVLLTARAGAEDTREGFEAGADDYLTKPFTPALVRTRVHEWLMRGQAASS